MNRILLLGSTGQLGSSFSKLLKQKKYQFFEYDLPELDLLDTVKTRKLISEIKPDILLNCIAYTNVASAENNRKQALAVNGTALKYLSEYCNENNTLLCHFSTDYVFDGKSKIPYCEEDKKNPLNSYGKSKSRGEDYVINICKKYIILRTAALFGISSGQNNTNIIEKFIQLGNEHSSLFSVIDEFTSPTFSDNLAEQTLKILENDLTGVFHATSNGMCNWLELAEYIFKKENITCQLTEISSREFNKRLVKPSFSVLENKRLKEENIDIMLPWQKAVDQYLKIRDNN